MVFLSLSLRHAMPGCPGAWPRGRPGAGGQCAQNREPKAPVGREVMVKPPNGNWGVARVVFLAKPVERVLS